MLIINIQRRRYGLAAFVVMYSKAVRALIQIRIAVRFGVRSKHHKIAQSNIEHVLLSVRPIVGQTQIDRIQLVACRFSNFAVFQCACAKIIGFFVRARPINITRRIVSDEAKRRLAEMHFSGKMVLPPTGNGNAVGRVEHERTTRVAVLDDIIDDRSGSVVTHTRLVVVLDADDIFRVNRHDFFAGCLNTVDAQLHRLVR